MSAPSEREIIAALRYLAQGDGVVPPPLDEDPVAIMLGLVVDPPDD